MISPEHPTRTGSFIGHVLPGSVAILYGLWWALEYSLRFFSQTTKISPTLKKILSWVEFVQWAALLCIGIIGTFTEQFLNHGPSFQLYSVEEHKWIYLHIWQHMSMYIFYSVAAVVGLFTASRFQIPLGLDRLVLSMALFNEGITFYFHIVYHPPLDYYVHSMLFLAIFSTAFCVLLEVHFRESPVLQLFRTSMFITQGTWLWQIALVLYPRWGMSSWDENDHENIMFITMCFTWHYMAAIFIIFVIYSMVYCFCRQRGRDYGDSAMEVKQFDQNKEAYTVLLNETDED